VNHPVVEHLLRRRGQAVPIEDGRKIALVLFGGTMCGVRGAGALLALHQLELTHAFDQLFTVSAGFANASYFLADQIELGLSVYYEEMTSGALINPFRLRMIVDADKLVKVCREVKPLQPERILASRSELFVRLVNAATGKREYLEVHNFRADEYFELFRAVITAPRVLGGKNIYLRGVPYHDTPFWGPDALGHINTALQSEATDILVIYNHRQHQKISFAGNERVLEVVPPPDWKLGRLETNPRRIREAASLMRNFVLELFRR